MPLVIVEFGNRTRAIVLELVDLRQIGRINQQESRSGADQGRNQHEKSQQHTADNLAPGNFNRWKLLINRTHWRMCSGYQFG